MTAPAPRGTGTRRVIVVNLDRGLPFATLVRRLCLDLYREQGLVDFWDVQDLESGSPSSDAASAELKRQAEVWSWWPRPIHGGARAAVAEMEEAIDRERRIDRQLLERTVVLVIGSVDDLSAAAQAGGKSPPKIFLDGLKQYLTSTPVKLVLLANAWRTRFEPHEIEGLRALVTVPADRPFQLKYSALLQTDLPAGRQLVGPAYAEAMFLQIRVAIDLFRSEQFCLPFFGAVDPETASTPVLQRRLLNLDGLPAQLDLARDDMLTAIRTALRRAHAEAQQVVADIRNNEPDPFLDELAGVVENIKRISLPMEQKFEPRLFPIRVSRTREIVERSIESRLRDAAPPHRSWLGGSRWTRDQSIEIELEAAFTAYLKDLDDAVDHILRGADSRLGVVEAEVIGTRRGLESSELANLGKPSSANRGRGFGAVNRASDNARAAQATLGRVQKSLDEQVQKFWDAFEPAPKPGSAKAPDARIAAFGPLVERHAPSLRTDWPEVQELAVAYAAAQDRAQRLLTRPRPLAWAGLSAVLFLFVPVMWIVGKYAGAIREPLIPVGGLGLWLLLLVLGLSLPWWVLAAGHRRFLDALKVLDAKLKVVQTTLEGKLKEVGRYLALMQEVNYAARLRQRIDELEREAQGLESYLGIVDRTLGTTGPSGAAGTPAARAGETLGEQLSTDTPPSAWLDQVLERVHDALQLGAGTIEAELPGAEATVKPAPSGLILRPSPIRISLMPMVRATA